MAQTLPSLTSTSTSGYVMPRARIDSVPQKPAIDTYQQDVGAAGEYFVFQVFKALFEIDENAWTSDIRTRFNFPAMDNFEGDYADITIKEYDSVARFTDWLIAGGHSEATQWKGQDITYHVEVKTTTGQCNEPFSMSNNQVRLVQQWHESPTDVCVLLRVFHFTLKPEIHCLMDPYALYLAGQLEFQAQGFWAQLT
ncbi:MAG: hypothetical protein M1822_005459 [Bathelium mastoideum]|nr:MAG: hypothetical protein M1822_005459 [Bathelium mastoideum]